MANKKAQDVFVMNRTLKFGVEMEIADLGVPHDEFINILVGRGVAVKRTGADHTTSTQWKVAYDSSIQATGNGYSAEIVSPPLTNFEDLKIVCEVLSQTGAKVNKSCGLHVHHDASDFTNLEQFKNLYQLWAKHEETMFSMLPLSRHHNSYCKAISGYQLEKVMNVGTMAEFKKQICGQGEGHYTSKRYYHINTTSYVRQGTIEFRGHSGTIDFEKIYMWVLLTNRILEKALDKKVIKPKTAKMLERESEQETARARHMYKEFGIGGTEIAYYIRKRRKAFKQA